MEDYIRESKPIIYGLKYNNLVIACHFKEKIIKKLLKQEFSLNKKEAKDKLRPFSKNIYYADLPAISGAMVVEYNNILLPANLIRIYVDYEYTYLEKLKSIKLDLLLAKSVKEKNNIKKLKKELNDHIINYSEKISILDLFNNKELRDRYEFYLNSNDWG